jgi:hypothetical protein
LAQEGVEEAAGVVGRFDGAGGSEGAGLAQEAPSVVEERAVRAAGAVGLGEAALEGSFIFLTP